MLRDNYAFLLHNGRQAAVVDPPVGEPLQQWLQGHGMELVAILHTHHHEDHIGGSRDLLRIWPHCRVYAARADHARIPFQTHGLEDGDGFTLLGREVRVMAVPGHTATHLAFHLPAHHPDEQGEVFCGDTLFAGGCGRLFEGTAEEMHSSLQRLMALPPPTRIWCAHEYTENNLRWAVSQAPNHPLIASRLAAVRAKRQAGEATIPSTVAEERATNLFVQARDANELARLRRHKDGWHG